MAISDTHTHGSPPAVGFVGCDMQSSTDSQAAPRRRKVTVGGRQVKTVDIHAHCAVAAAMALMNLHLAPPVLAMSDTDERLAAMDAQGIDVEVLSINPFWYAADRDLAAEVIRLQNEALAEICGRADKRFAAFASVALQHPDLAVEQLTHAVKTLGLRGAAVGGSVEGEELSSPRFHPFWAKAEELGVLIFLHPQGSRELAATGRLKGSGLLDNTIGNPLETTIALSHLIFEGTLDRYPGLKLCAAHGGGYLPSYCARSDAVCGVFPARVGPLPQKPPTAYLKQLYYDSIVFTPEALRHLAAEVGPDRIMMGTDYPYPWTDTSVDHILATPGLSDAEKIAMLGGTAEVLMGLT